MSHRITINYWAAVWLIVLLTFICLPSHAHSFQLVSDRVESFTPPVSTGSELSSPKPRRATASPRPLSISIGPVSQEKTAQIAADPSQDIPYKIGFGREVPQLGSTTDTKAFIQWQDTTQGGKISAISITSQQANGIRLGILVRRLPEDAILRFYSQGAEATYEISGKEVMVTIRRNLNADDSSDAARTYWAPFVEGEEATMEIELPQGVSPDTVEIAIPQVSHFFLHPLAAAGGNVIKSIGDSASCEIDATCYSNWSAEGNATAKMTFVKDGGSYLCSGTLLNDTQSSRTPYFLSANHCISRQTVASTLQTFWFYRSIYCNSGTLNPGSSTLSGGATLLYASSATDTSFMKLDGTPPAGATYEGWDSGAPVLGTDVTGVHHPKGDLQKISFGSLQSFKDCTTPSSGYFSCSDSTQAAGEYINITYSTGIVEGGSSGSGLFKTTGSSRYLIGQLYGGSSSCSNPSGINIYGRFDLAYNAALHQWLKPGSTFSLSVSKLGNGSGTVTSSPSGINCGTACSAPFDVGSSVTLTATPASGSTFSGWSGACSGAGATCTVVMDAAKEVTANFSIPNISLGSALDNTNLAWATGGNVPFAAQTASFYYGGSAAQTGKIGDNQSTYLSTNITGPGTLSFYWNVSSEKDYDFFTVYLDGVVRYRWSGNGSWTKSTLTIPAGPHTVKWEYVKDEYVSSGQDAGWVDYVSFIPGACTYTLYPTSSSVTASSSSRTITVYPSASDCPWTANSNASWITIISGTSGTGTGAVSYYVDANTGSARTGTITVAEQTFTVTQSAPVQISDLATAVDNTTLTWTTGGNANWVYQTVTSYYAGNAARSGAIDGNKSTWLQTTITGPGQVNFYWKVSSEVNYDYLKFYINNVLQKSISGEVDWRRETFTLPSGNNTLKWVYAKDEAGTVAQDRGWLDKVVFCAQDLCGASPVNVVMNSLGPNNAIKVSDMSGLLPAGGSAITVNAWDVYGRSLVESEVAAPLRLYSNKTTTITGSELADRFPTVSPMAYELSVYSSPFIITNVKSSADGTLNVPSGYTRGTTNFVTNSVGPRNTIKITDMSGTLSPSGASITIKAWDANGNALTESATAPLLKLNSRATTTIMGPDLMARFPSTPMTYEFIVDSSKFIVTNVKNSTDGTINIPYGYSRGVSNFAANSIGRMNTLRITDMSGSLPGDGAAITVTAWDAAGNALSQSESAMPLKLYSRGTTTINGSDLIARFPSGAPMAYEFTVNSSKYVVTNIKSSIDGNVKIPYIYTNGMSNYATNCVSSLNTIKITDLSGSVRARTYIKIAAWDADGNVVQESGNAESLRLNSRATTTINGSDLIARFPTGTPVSYEFTIESSQYEVTNLTSSMDGLISIPNIYTSGIDGGI